jgi:hypothetical protein
MASIVELLGEYIQEQGLTGPEQLDKPLFANRHGGRLSRSGVRYLVAKLRREVEDLLRHCERKGSFLESPVSAVAFTIDEPVTECPGTVIGPYKLLEQIGEGGMGVVYMAGRNWQFVAGKTGTLRVWTYTFRSKPVPYADRLRIA